MRVECTAKEIELDGDYALAAKPGGPPTAQSVRALLDALEGLTIERLARKMTCPRCKASADESCRRPGGDAIARYHTGRQDRAVRVANKCPTWLRLELSLGERGDMSPDCSPAHVLARLRASKLYRFAMSGGLFGADYVAEDA